MIMSWNETDDDQITIGAVLRTWYEELILEDINSWKRRILYYIRPNKLTVALTTLQLCWTFMHVWNSHLTEGGMVGLLILLGMYSANCAQVFFVWRSRKVAHALLDLTYVANQIKLFSEPAAKKAMNSTARFCTKITLADRRYHLLVVSMLVSRAFAGKYVLPVWPESLINKTPVLRIIILLLQICVSIPNLYATCHLLVLTMTTTWCSSALYHALGEKLRKEEDFGTLRHLVQLHQALTRSSFHLYKMYSDVMFHFLVTYFFVPLFCSYEIVAGRVDFLVLGTLPVAFLFLIPLCSAGDLLQESSTSVSFAAYQGHWLQANHATRQLYHLIMMRSRVPSQISVYQFQVLDHVTCFKAMKTWFSYLQMILNFQ